MTDEVEIREEIVRLTRRLEELERSESETTTTTTPSLTVVETNNSKAKPDNYSDGPWPEWINHFKLCADINKWNDTQRCQQLAVALRGRAQRIYFSLNDEEKASFEELEKALQSRLQPEQQRKIHKLTFNSRRRLKGETIIDLATNLRQLAVLAYSEKDSRFVEEEMVDQFIKALDTRELRVGVSQADPKTLDDAVKLALKLESIHLTETQQNPSKINMASPDTADSCMAGSSFKDADSAPKWAQKFLENQTALLGKMTEYLENKPTGNKRNRRIECYNCGKPGHIARNCWNHDRNQGNANRAGSQLNP